jgi:hypothetical protein
LAPQCGASRWVHILTCRNLTVRAARMIVQNRLSKSEATGSPQRHPQF